LVDHAYKDAVERRVSKLEPEVKFCHQGALFQIQFWRHIQEIFTKFVMWVENGTPQFRICHQIRDRKYGSASLGASGGPAIIMSQSGRYLVYIVTVSILVCSHSAASITHNSAVHRAETLDTENYVESKKTRL